MSADVWGRGLVEGVKEVDLQYYCENKRDVKETLVSIYRLAI